MHLIYVTTTTHGWAGDNIQWGNAYMVFFTSISLLVLDNKKENEEEMKTRKSRRKFETQKFNIFSNGLYFYLRFLFFYFVS